MRDGSFESLCRAWEEEFARNRRLHGDRLRCRPGCDRCCHQMFQITEPEAAVISSGINTLAPELRERLRARAAEYVRGRTSLAPEEAWGSLPPPGSRLACPALEDGRCTIYEFRPLICRKYGVPLWNPDRPGRLAACELNFGDGEEIRDGDLIRIQTGLHEQARAWQSAYNRAGGYRDPNPVTIARAILEDFPALVE